MSATLRMVEPSVSQERMFGLRASGKAIVPTGGGVYLKILCGWALAHARASGEAAHFTAFSTS